MFGKVKTIKQKLIISNIMVLMIVSAIYSVYNYYQMIRQLEQQAEHALEYHVESVASRMDIAYEEMCDLILNTSAEAGKFSYSKKKAVEISENLNLLCNNSSLSDYIMKLMIVYSPEKFIQRGSVYGSADDVSQLLSADWYQEETDKQMNSYDLQVVEAPFFEARGEQMIPMRMEGKAGSFLFLGISPKVFDTILAEYQSDNGIVIFTEDGDLVASRNISEEQCSQLWASWSENKDAQQGFYDDWMEGDRWLVSYKQNEKSNLIVCEILAGDTLTNERMDVVRMITALFIAALSIGMLSFRMLSRQIDRPIQRLIYRIGRISKGNFEQDPTIEGEDELGKIGIVINRMSDQIKNYMYEEIQSEKEKKDLEIRMLQAQINPHFLYNTLDSIKWVAAVQENTGIVNVVTALSGLLRNMAKGFNEKVTLKKELDFLEDYITVERFKYVELFDVETVVEDPVLYKAGIVKLTLQPIVENAILSGIEPSRRVGKIQIRIWQEKQRLLITVRDNGVGMTEEKVASVLKEGSDKSKKSLNGIGLKNVDRRLKLVYGEESGISVKSVLGEGTEVKIQVPLEFEEEETCTES